jgi:hypothetical protein
MLLEPNLFTALPVALHMLHKLCVCCRALRALIHFQFCKDGRWPARSANRAGSVLHSLAAGTFQVEHPVPHI